MNPNPTSCPNCGNYETEFFYGEESLTQPNGTFLGIPSVRRTPFRIEYEVCTHCGNIKNMRCVRS